MLFFIVQMHKKTHFLSVTILNSKVKYRSFFSKNMTDKLINSKSCRNRKFSVIVQQEYRKDVVLAAIFYFDYLKVLRHQISKKHQI